MNKKEKEMRPNSYTSNILDAPDSEIVCWCSMVPKATIMAAKSQGATTLEQIRVLTGACTVGRCRELSPRRRCCSKEIKELLAINETTSKGEKG